MTRMSFSATSGFELLSEFSSGFWNFYVRNEEMSTVLLIDAIFSPTYLDDNRQIFDVSSFSDEQFLSNFCSFEMFLSYNMTS